MPPPVIRSKSFRAPTVQNPFKTELQLPWYRKIQMAVATLTIVPIRILLMCLFTLLAWLTACVILIGVTPQDLAREPLSGWRRQLRKLVHFWTVASFVSFGFIWKHKGKPVPQTEIVAIPVAPHSSFCDVVVAVVLDELPYAVSRVENLSVPFIGKLVQLVQPISVSREDKDSRHKTIAEIKARANSGGKWPPFLIFPEGTTTNGRSLISFKVGAFIPGKPVQPVLLRYPDSWDTVTWTWEGPGTAMCLWMSMCKLWITMEVEYLPVYYPNEQEQSDPYIYAENVRQTMARALDVPVTDHSYEDCRLMEYAQKANLKMGDVLVECRKMQKKLGMNYEQVRELLDKFSAMSHLNDNGGQVDIDTFAKYMGLPVNDTLRELFNLYDRDGSGNIDFREYVLGMSLVSQPASADETVQLAFKLFDRDSKGHVTKIEFSELLLDTLDVSQADADKLFEKVDATGSGKVTYEDFKVCAQQMPEYAALFTTYHNMKENGSLGVDPGDGSESQSSSSSMSDKKSQ